MLYVCVGLWRSLLRRIIEYKSTLIFFLLGSFTFDTTKNMWSKDTLHLTNSFHGLVPVILVTAYSFHCIIFPYISHVLKILSSQMVL